MTPTSENGSRRILLPGSRQKKDRIWNIVNIIFAVLTVVLIAGGTWWFHTVIWAKSTWSELTFQEMIYTLSTLTGTDTSLVSKHIVHCIIPGIIMAVPAILFVIYAFRRRTLLHMVQIFGSVFGIIIIAVASITAWDELGITDYIEGQEAVGSFIDENYVDPTSVSLQFPEQKRNLIYIFLESMENTFADTESGGAFDENVISDLTRLSMENENFSGSENILNGGHDMKGATWTIAAMFAQSSGLPLLLPIGDNSMDLQEEFLPGVTSLGDILEDEGYRQVLLLGSDADFGGRALYYTQHGNYEIRDYDYYLENGTLPEGYKVWWGYEDSKLIQNAKDTLTELAKSDQPFNLTMLTVDTHFPDGYICDLCGDEFEDQYSNVYACSSKQIAELVEWIQEQPFYENTTIVISGDHETMDEDYCQSVDEYDRTVYTTYINSAVTYDSDTKREYSTFDDFPTTLAALGVEIPGDRLGLGVNLYSSTKTLYETYGKKLFNEGLNEKSELMENLTAGIITQFLTFDTTDYDAENKTLNVRVSNVKKPEGTEQLKAAAWIDGEELNKVYVDVTEDDEGGCSFTVNFADFGLTQGKYMIELYAVVDGEESRLASTSVQLDNADSAEGISAADVNVSIQFGEFDYQTGTFPVYVYNAPASTIMMSLEVNTEDNPDNAEWIQMGLDENGTYYANVSAVDFGVVTNSFVVNAYATYDTGESELRATATNKIE